MRSRQQDLLNLTRTTSLQMTKLGRQKPRTFPQLPVLLRFRSHSIQIPINSSTRQTHCFPSSNTMEIYGMMGERLGPSSATPSATTSANKAMPPWQRDFLKKPSISVRKGIVSPLRDLSQCLPKPAHGSEANVQAGLGKSLTSGLSLPTLVPSR
jgi:hypothetical protein